MPATYNGSAAGIAAHEAPAIQTALATDLLSEEGFNVGLRKLADYVAYLNQKGALLDVVNLFTAIVQLGTGSGLELTAAALQSILKKGSGKLQLGTAAANNSDLELLVNGVVKFGLLAAGGIDAKGERLTNLGAPVGATDALRFGDAASAPTASKLALRDAAGRAQFADPAAAQDAATKAYADGLVVSTQQGATLGTGWSAGTNLCYKTGKVVTLNIAVQGSASASWSSLATLPAGYVPIGAIRFPGFLKNAGTSYPCWFYVLGSDLKIDSWDNGTSLVNSASLVAPASSNDGFSCYGTYLVP